MKISAARIDWKQSIPSPAKAFVNFKGFASDDSRMNRIYDLLVLFIQNHRGRVARRFYPTRDLAEFFGVSTSTIAIVYRRLQHEGLLTLVRGSQSMIPARAPRTRTAVRGVVAMPIWMPAFFRFADWRRWFVIVQQELARHRFAAELIFFQPTEDTRQISFVDRMLQFNPDYVLWFYPSRSELNALRSFVDAGVPVLSINDYRDDFPARVYPLSYDQAFQQGLQEWKKSGKINEVIIPQGHADISESLKTALKNCALPYRIEPFFGIRSDLPKYLSHLTSRPRRGIIFEDEFLYAIMCTWDPAGMLKLLRHQRAMTKRHVLIPGCRMEEIKIDVLSFSYEHLARRIALDLSQAKGGIVSRQPVFHAEWRPQTPLAEVSESDIPE